MQGRIFDDEAYWQYLMDIARDEPYDRESEMVTPRIAEVTDKDGVFQEAIRRM